MLKSIKILIVDDHPVFRAGIRAILRQRQDLEIIAEAASCREAVSLLQDVQPDIILLDIDLPDRSGIDLCRELRSEHQNLKILFISFLKKQEVISSAFAAGAVGYICKDAAADNLIKGIDTILTSKKYIDETIHESIVQLITGEKPRQNPDNEAYKALTQRERQVLTLVAEGLTSKEVAHRLEISAKTVDNIRSAINEKLHLSSPVELVRFAMRIGLVDTGL